MVIERSTPAQQRRSMKRANRSWGSGRTFSPGASVASRPRSTGQRRHPTWPCRSPGFPSDPRCSSNSDGMQLCDSGSDRLASYLSRILAISRKPPLCFEARVGFDPGSLRGPVVFLAGPVDTPHEVRVLNDALLDARVFSCRRHASGDSFCTPAVVMAIVKACRRVMPPNDRTSQLSSCFGCSSDVTHRRLRKTGFTPSERSPSAATAA